MSTGEMINAQGAHGRETFARPRVRDVLWGQRMRPLWSVALYGFLIFPIFRVILFLVRREVVRDTPMSEIWRCFGYGLQFDGVVVGYALLPLVVALCAAPARAFAREGFRRAITIYGTVLMALVVLMEVVGAIFLMDYRRRLNWATLTYFRHPGEVVGFIWNEYGYLIVVLFPALLGVSYVVYRVLHRGFWRGEVGCNSLPWRLGMTAALTGVCVLACRGTLGHLPLRPGDETHSANNLVNQLSSNNAFNLYHAAKSIVRDGTDEQKFYDFPDRDEARRIAEGLLRQEGETMLTVPGRPLLRRVETGLPRRDLNVVVIIMEGQASEPVGALGYPASHTPELDRLCEAGLSFDRMYAVGARTSRAMVGVLCGHPDLGGQTLMWRDDARGRFRTLPTILAERGYRTAFIYGGDPDFDNMRRFFRTGGIRTVIGQEQIDETRAGNWGVPDEMIFQKAHETFMSMGDKPFFAAILTVSNHQPYRIPPGRPIMLFADDSKEHKMLNAYRYADWALGEFFREAAEAPYFKNTVFIMVADHGHAEYLDFARAIDVPGYRVPCVFYAPGIIPPQRITTVASQTDIAPTLLGMLGGRYEHSFLGRDIRKVVPGDGFALLHEDRHLGFVRQGRALVLPPRNTRRRPRPVPVLFNTGLFDMQPIAPGGADPHEVRRLKREMLSLYWTALQQYLSVKKPER